MGSEIFYRNEADEIKQIRGWVLIYGRRKVGKTFLIKNFLEYDVYFRIKRDGGVWAEKFTISNINSIEDFSRIVLDLLSKNNTVVIDEFQRLPEHVLEDLATAHPKGKLIFSGSSLRIIKRMLAEKSPLLGLTAQYNLGLLKPSNIIRELSKHISPEKTMELAPYLADPWTVPFAALDDESLKTVYGLARYSKLTIPGLIGEVFTEEERELTIAYDAILRLLGSGKWRYKEVASILENRGIIKRADSSLVLPYLKNLIDMGLIETLPLHNSKKKMYKLASPVMEVFYYLCDRYDFDESDAGFPEVKPSLEKLRNLAVQNFTANLFAEIYDGRKEYHVTPENEIDFIVRSRKKAVVSGEVKWGKYGMRYLRKFDEKTKKLGLESAERVFIVKKKTAAKLEGLTIMEAADLVRMSREKTKARFG